MPSTITLRDPPISYISNKTSPNYFAILLTYPQNFSFTRPHRLKRFSLCVHTFHSSKKENVDTFPFEYKPQYFMPPKSFLRHDYKKNRKAYTRDNPWYKEAFCKNSERSYNIAINTSK